MRALGSSEMLDFTYAGPWVSATEPPPDVAARLDPLLPLRAVAVDRAILPWVDQALDRWAAERRVSRRVAVVDAGRVISPGRPVVLSDPDRAGRRVRLAGNDRGVVVVRDPALVDLRREAGVEGAGLPPAEARAARRLARKLAQVRGVRVIHEPETGLCAYLQPDEPERILERMLAAGVAGGDPLGLPEFAGGIMTVVHPGRTTAHLDRYVATLRRALD